MKKYIGTVICFIVAFIAAFVFCAYLTSVMIAFSWVQGVTQWDMTLTYFFYNPVLKIIVSAIFAVACAALYSFIKKKQKTLKHN